MTASPVLLADAITAVVNADVAANAFGGLSFTARRSYPDWDDDFKDLKTLAVDVVFVSSSGSGVLAELDSERSIQTEQAIDIAVRYRFAPSERDGRVLNSAADPYVNLVERLHEKLAGDKMQAITLESGCTANWIDTSVRTYCDYKRLREGVFLGVVRVTFDVSKVL